MNIVHRLYWFAALAPLSACSGVTTPGQVGSWDEIAAGPWYTCGLAATGEAYCWGGIAGTRDGDLENPPMPRTAVPVRVPGGDKYESISVGEGFACALDATRRAYCWGGNSRGQLGDGTLASKFSSSSVLGDHEWLVVQGGLSHACGITTEHRAYCWGNPFLGALGNGMIDGGAVTAPDAVLGGYVFVDITAGSAFTCALTPDGEAYCWGASDNGTLGDGQPPGHSQSAVPVKVVGGLRFTSISSGSYHTCALTAEGRAYCWGYGGVLGDGTAQASSVPVPVAGNHTWSQISVGNGHTCGLTAEGAVYCWGNAERGRFGDGFLGIALEPRRVAEPGRYRSLAAGGQHTCGIDPRGRAYCWGRGDHGQLGHGRFEDSGVPVRVGGGR